MKTQNIVMLVIALLAGLAAVYLAQNYIDQEVSQHKNKIDEQYKPIKIVVAKRSLQRGEILNSSLLAIRHVPSAFVHGDAIRPGEVDSILGHRLVYSLNQGESMLSTHVAYSKGDTFSNLIDDGKRAITFPVDVLSSMTGMMAPGDLIDLLVTLKDGDTEKTFPMLTSVLVMATGTEIDEIGVAQVEANKYQTITLHVTPEEAAMITHANNEGDITVLLRSRSDNKQLAMSAVTKNTLLGRKNKQLKASPTGPRIIRAGKK